MEDNSQPKPPPHSPAAMNLTDVGMDNFCTFHQQRHSKKNFPQWINSMTMVMNKLLDSKLTETGKEEEKDNQSIEKQEEDTLVLWDCVSMFDIEEESLKQEETSETNVTTRSQSLLKEDKSILLKIKKLQENMKKIQKNTTTVKIPEFTISSQNTKKNNMPVKPVEDKVDNVKKNLKEPEMGYDIVEDIKKAKENISLFEMCNVP